MNGVIQSKFGLHVPRHGKLINAVIFDWGGTLVDPFSISPALSFVRSFKESGVRVTMEEARKPMGIRKDLHIKKMLEMDDIRNRWVAEKGVGPTKQDKLNIYEMFKIIQKNVVNDYSALTPYAGDTFKILRGCYKLKIGTTTGFDKDIVKIILQNNRNFVPDSVVCGDDLREDLGSRPNPFMIWKNLFHMKISNISSVIKVDDTISGIQEGLNAGCWTVGVINYSNYMNVDSVDEYKKMTHREINERREKTKQILLNAGAHYVIDDLSKLPLVIDIINDRLANH